MPFCCLGGQPQNSSNISIENSIEDCIALKPANVEKTAFSLILHISIKFKQSVAECGCKSRVLSYDFTEKVKIDDSDAEYERLYAQKIAPDSGVGDYPFVISADPAIDYQGVVAVKIGCQGPD